MHVDAKERAYFLAPQPAAIKQPKQCRQNYFPSPERTIGLNGIELFKESIDLFFREEIRILRSRLGCRFGRNHIRLLKSACQQVAAEFTEDRYHLIQRTRGAGQ